MTSAIKAWLKCWLFYTISVVFWPEHVTDISFTPQEIVSFLGGKMNPKNAIVYLLLYWFNAVQLNMCSSHRAMDSVLETVELGKCLNTTKRRWYDYQNAEVLLAKPEMTTKWASVCEHVFFFLFSLSICLRLCVKRNVWTLHSSRIMVVRTTMFILASCG